MSRTLRRCTGSGQSSAVSSQFSYTRTCSPETRRPARQNPRSPVAKSNTSNRTKPSRFPAMSRFFAYFELGKNALCIACFERVPYPTQVYWVGPIICSVVAVLLYQRPANRAKFGPRTSFNWPAWAIFQH